MRRFFLPKFWKFFLPDPHFVRVWKRGCVKLYCTIKHINVHIRMLASTTAPTLCMCESATVQTPTLCICESATVQTPTLCICESATVQTPWILANTCTLMTPHGIHISAACKFSLQWYTSLSWHCQSWWWYSVLHPQVSAWGPTEGPLQCGSLCQSS